MKKHFLVEKSSGTVYAVSDGKIEFTSDKLELQEVDIDESNLKDVLNNKPAKVKDKKIEF